MSYILDQEKSWIQRDFGLDRRLIKALSKVIINDFSLSTLIIKLGFTYPTLVQAKCIPIALQGKDLMVRARTGSGKTIAFSLPVLQKILSVKDNDQKDSQPFIKCLILAPTKELIKQIESHITDLIYYCRDNISICSLTDDNISVQQYRLQSKPDIVVTTPARLVQHIKTNKVDLSQISTMVIDEADLILSFGYTEDIHIIKSKMPKIFQGILMSATLSAELDKFKRVVLHNPAVLRLEEPQGLGNILQFYLESTEYDKYLILYVFIKLGLLQGKGLIFVNDVNKCYRLKLFFQQFFISAAVLNAELPLNTRIHILEEYNRGVFDYLIATDASVDNGEKDEREHDEEEEEEGDEEGKSKKKDKKKKKRKSSDDDEYGVSRGIDFQGVNFVINFDFPPTSAAYTHRIGRTARGNATGTALSFVTKAEASNKECEIADREHELLDEVRTKQPRLGVVENDNILAAISTGDDNSITGFDKDEKRMQPAPLMFNMNELDSFRYRVEDIIRSVTSSAVRELRNAEIKKEILNSEKLKSYFSENPNDLKVLRHDKAILHPIRQHDHLKFVPDYLIPSSMRSVAVVTNKKKNKKRNKNVSTSHEQRVLKSKMKDPLQLASSDNDNNNNNMDNDNTDVMVEDDNEVEDIKDRVFTNTESLGKSMSGRKNWKLRHKKGQFNPKAGKRSTHRTPGSFIKSKSYK